MLTFSLQSGSNGNSIYVEANGTRLLFDAGISGKQAAERLAVYGRDIRSVDALIVSHDHRDHVQCAGVYQRKFGLPIYVTRPTLAAAARGTKLGALTDVRHFQAGDALYFHGRSGAGRHGVTVHTIRTPHDGADGVAFVVECGGRRLGILTDLGHPFTALQDVFESVDAVYIEANYDADRLMAGAYPWPLKQRIRGPGGHLSNDEAAALLRACGRRRPQWVAVAHLSADNNDPTLAVDAQRAAVGSDYPVYHASRHGASPIWTV